MLLHVSVTLLSGGVLDGWQPLSARSFHEQNKGADVTNWDKTNHILFFLYKKKISNGTKH